MKKTLILLLAVLLPCLGFAEEASRTWKSKSGKTIIEAVWDSENDPDAETVFFLKDGKRFKVPFRKLSDDDQKYVTNGREKKSSRSTEEDFGLEEVTASSKGLEVIPTSNRYALLIGVNTYYKPIRSLRYCKTDMQVLSECFQKIGFPKENIFLMTDDSEGVYQPTGANIRRQIESVTSLMTENDLLFVAFSGHGAEVEGEAYLCPSDTSLNSVSSLVSREWAFTELDQCKAGQKIFLVDACRDEVVMGGGKSLSGARTLEDPTGAKGHGFILLASCDRKQQSWEDPATEQGVFTHYFTEGLSGAAKDEEGYVSLLNLFSYTSRKTKMHVFKTFNMVQVPTLKPGGEMTDILLAKLDSSLPPPEERKAGEKLVKTVDGIEYVFHWCPAGTFQMGSPEGEEGRSSDETQHTVTLTKGFWMLETEVTQEMWKSVMGNNPGFFKEGDKYPVENVSWGDCQDFCQALSGKLGVTITLPTEAQWEYACRAGTTGRYAGYALDAMGWYDDNSDSKTHIVGQKNPNPWGLYDMHGNVYEWCSDWFGDYSGSATTDPTGASTGSHRVDRGGSWYDPAEDCRSANRNIYTPSYRNSDLGFRLALLVP